MSTLQAGPVPIREADDGSLRVGESRVLLELVLEAFDDGASPEAILQRYSTLRLPDVYSVIAHHVNHPGEWAAYLRRRELQAVEVFNKVTSGQRDLGEIRGRLFAMRRAAGSTNAPPRG